MYINGASIIQYGYRERQLKALFPRSGAMVASCGRRSACPRHSPGDPPITADIAGPGRPGDPDQCRICWLRLKGRR